MHISNKADNLIVNNKTKKKTVEIVEVWYYIVPDGFFLFLLAWKIKIKSERALTNV